MKVKVYELDHYKKARIWFEPNKDLFFEGEQIHSYEFISNPSKLKHNKTVIFELFLPRGGRIIHGILGMDFIYNERNKILIKIPIKNKTQKVVSSLLKYENVYLGLPDEYLNAVKRGIERAYREKKLLLTGELNFCYAAYGDVSSCEWVFDKLTYSLIGLIVLLPEDINKEIMERISKQTGS